MLHFKRWLTLARVSQHDVSHNWWSREILTVGQQGIGVVGATRAGADNFEVVGGVFSNASVCFVDGPLCWNSVAGFFDVGQVIIVGLHEVGRGGDGGAKGEVSRRCKWEGKGKGQGLEGGVVEHVWLSCCSIVGSLETMCAREMTYILRF